MNCFRMVSFVFWWLMVITPIHAIPVGIDGHFDHQSHAKAGEPQVIYENPPDSGFAYATLDGTLSHSHYFNQGPPVETGRIVSYQWIDQTTGYAYGNESIIRRRFPVGTTRVLLRVVDQTGDTSEAQTAITVISSATELKGVLAYYYDQLTINQFAISNPRPFFSQWLPTAAIWSHMDLPKEMRAIVPGAVRLVTEFYPRRTGKYRFMVQYRGGKVQCFIDDQKIAGGTAINEKQTKQVWFTKSCVQGRKLRVELLLSRRFLPVQLVFFNYAMADESQPASALGVTNQQRLSFKPRIVVPIALYGSVSESSVDGGIPYELRASGLDGAGDIQVVFQSRSRKESKRMEIKRIDASQGMIYGTIPSFPRACYATVQLITKLKGNSNELPFHFVEMKPGLTKRDQRRNGLTKIGFRKDVLRTKEGKPFKLSAISTIVLGADGRFYMGSLNGVIHVVRTDSSSVRVVSHCKSTKVSEQGSILGMAFNPREEYSKDSQRLYLSVSVLYHTIKNTGYRWDNGKIVIWKSVSDERCMIFEKDLITGLPVSDRDHGVNSLTFDHDNNLYISIGSNTNGGVKSPEFGNLPETALSASIAIAPLGKAGFNGRIKYDQYKNAGSAKIIGGDVKTYATGIRNSFGMCYHSKLGLFATDNGHNKGFGPLSKTCNSENKTLKTQKDRLLRIEKNEWYGHGNRNRGECETSTNVRTGLITEMTPSTTGVIEYTSNRFQAQLLGDLLLSKFAVHGEGITSRVAIESGYHNAIQVEEISGVSISIGPKGEIVMPQVQQGKVAILVPKEETTQTSIWSVVPRYGLSKGGNLIRIYGFGINVSNVMIRVGGIECTMMKIVEDWIECVTPSGQRGHVNVTAQVEGLETWSSGREYQYI